MFLPKNQFFKSPVALFSVIALLCISVIAAFIAAESSQDIRNRASTATGAVEVMLNPANGTYFSSEAGTKRTITLTANTFAEKVVGFELFLDFTGIVPSDITFTPAERTDISVVTSDFSTTSTGKRLTLGLLPPIANPPKSFSTNGNAVTLGTLTYTTPSSGQMSAMFDPTLSRVLRFNADPTQTAEVDVLHKQTGAFSYTFGLSASPNPRPSSSPSSILSNPSITPSPIVCFNRVVVSGSRLYWTDGCKGNPAVSTCIQVVTELTAAEKTAYQQWISAGKPLSAACTSKGTPTIRPTAPPGCVYQTVQCIQAPCDPILVCSSPKPSPATTPPTSSILWKTPYVSLSADSLQIQVNGKTFTGAAQGTVSIHSDPGSSTYTTLESTWREHGVEMRLYMYFAADSSRWRITEMRTYDGNANGNWVFYPGDFSAPLGSAFTATAYSRTSNGLVPTGNVVMKNMKVWTSLKGGFQTPTPSPTTRVNDDLFFAPETDANSVFWFYEAGTRTFVSSSQLVAGKTYTVEINPQVQNNVKTTTIDNRNLQVALRINGSILDTANNFYSLVSNHTGGATFRFSVNFVAAANNVFEVVIDPYNSLQETNESNNTLRREYPGAAGSSTQTPVPVTQCLLGNLSILPYPDLDWNHTGSFQITNTGKAPITFGWHLDNWSDDTRDSRGISTLAPKEITVLGLGKICSKWSLNVSCLGTQQMRGFTVESNQQACQNTNPSIPPVATPVVILPSPPPTAQPGSSISSEQWRRLPAWLQQLIQQFLR